MLSQNVELLEQDDQNVIFRDYSFGITECGERETLFRIESSFSMLTHARIFTKHAN